MMEAASASETSFNTRLHAATSQKTVIFILVAVCTSNVTTLIFLHELAVKLGCNGTVEKMTQR
jgi:hypothetical protein